MAGNADMVSVLMCVYNTPVIYLKEAVNSILQQTCSDIEFVIVDDASDDYSVLDFLNELENADERVRVFHNSNNLGLTCSLNIGMSNCHGEYIARMDSDDVAIPERLQRQCDYLTKNPQIALVGSDIICFGYDIDEVAVSGQKEYDDPEVYRIRSLFLHPGPPHPSFMFRGEFLRGNDIKYREEIIRAQDYGIIADILMAGGTIYRIKEPLLKYRVHPGQITFGAEIEQKAYQSRVSRDFIHSVFPQLTDVECSVLSILGCDCDIGTLMDAVNGVTKLSDVCSFLIRNEESLKDSRRYVCAIKRVIGLNKDQEEFNSVKFESELRRMWWKKALRMSKKVKRPWGMWPYTLLSYVFCLIH